MFDWNKTAFIFPGQGSQSVGMGHDLAQAYPLASDIFQQADEQIGFNLSGLMFNGPKEELDDTSITQPAMYVCSVAYLRVIESLIPDARPAFVAGHSLGELTALTAAGSLTFDEGVILVRERGRLMKEAGDRVPGGMAALLGLPVEKVREICDNATEQTGKPVVMANDNCPGQVVISGNNDALNRALELAAEAGAKTVRLAVSTAPHSPLMEPAQTDFAKVVAQTNFVPPEIPVYGNITAALLQNVASIRQELEAQLTSPVHWTDIMQNLIADGIETFVEIGSGTVLAGMLKRMDRSKQRININSVESLRAFVENAS